jgi:hypothetical protein
MERTSRMNVANGPQDPMTLEVGFVSCSGAILLPGSQERRHDAHFETGILELANDSSLMERESARSIRFVSSAKGVHEVPH